MCDFFFLVGGSSKEPLQGKLVTFCKAINCNKSDTKKLSTDGDLVVPNKTQDNTFVYIVSNGTVYDVIKRTGSSVKDFLTARQVCQQKGGDLVSISLKITKS